jgi:multimeric flavodoxin WrbA
MKVIAFNGSARKDSNTAILINYVLEELQREGIETELFQMAGKKIHGCKGCYQCFINQDRNCAIKDDIANECIEKMFEADGVILGSPVYVADVSPEMKALIDRTCMVGKANGGMLKHKVGAGVVAVRRAGSVRTIDSINHLFFVSEMIVPGSSYWNMAFGLEKGDVERDAEGIRTMKDLGANMAWLMKKLYG